MPRYLIEIVHTGIASLFVRGFSTCTLDRRDAMPFLNEVQARRWADDYMDGLNWRIISE